MNPRLQLSSSEVLAQEIFSGGRKRLFDNVISVDYCLSQVHNFVSILNAVAKEQKLDGT